MKIHILFKILSGPYGGGNQFLKALKKELIKKNAYAFKIKNADIVLFNSHQDFQDVIKAKKRFPKKLFIHRVDGPIFDIRGTDKEVDDLIFKLNDKIADATVYQSLWSQKKCYTRGMKKNKFETQVYNAPDNDHFNRKNKLKFNSKKPKIMISSWSDNWNKGFKTYQFLDDNLDFNKFEVSFLGNSPIAFKNIKMLKPVSPPCVAKILKKHDIYLTASQNDPCSNSLIEALSCGLPAVVLSDGGHPEIVGLGGEVFKNQTDLIDKINKISKNYYKYKVLVPNYNISLIANKYIQFMKSVYNQSQQGQYEPKTIGLMDEIGFMKLRVLMIFTRMKKIIKKIQLSNSNDHSNSKSQ